MHLWESTLNNLNLIPENKLQFPSIIKLKTEPSTPNYLILKAQTPWTWLPLIKSSIQWLNWHPILTCLSSLLKINLFIQCQKLIIKIAYLQILVIKIFPKNQLTHHWISKDPELWFLFRRVLPQFAAIPKELKFYQIKSPWNDVLNICIYKIINH